jgi:hypothetical protein
MPTAKTTLERTRALQRESERKRRESALTILFTATRLLASRLRLRGAVRSPSAR